MTLLILVTVAWDQSIIHIQTTESGSNKRLEAVLRDIYCISDVTVFLLWLYSGFRLKRPRIKGPMAIVYKDQYFWSQYVLMQ